MKITIDLNEMKIKRLIQVRQELVALKGVEVALEQILNAEIEVSDYNETIYSRISQLESELIDLKCELDVSDAEWDEDES
jgi:hypothetical protein